MVRVALAPISAYFYRILLVFIEKSCPVARDLLPSAHTAVQSRFDSSGGAANIISSHQKTGFTTVGGGDDAAASFRRPGTQTSGIKTFDDGANPFALPSEDEIYKMRHKEREQKEAVSARASALV